MSNLSKPLRSSISIRVGSNESDVGSVPAWSMLGVLASLGGWALGVVESAAPWRVDDTEDTASAFGGESDRTAPSTTNGHIGFTLPSPIHKHCISFQSLWTPAGNAHDNATILLLNAAQVTLYFQSMLTLKAGEGMRLGWGCGVNSINLHYSHFDHPAYPDPYSPCLLKPVVWGKIYNFENSA